MIDFVAVAMLFLVVYTFAAFGLAYVVGHSVITKRLREVAFGPLTTEDIHKNANGLPIPITPRRFPVMLVECPACFGFWIGLGTGFLISNAVPIFPNWSIIASFAFYTAGTNFIFAKLTDLMD